MNDRLPTYEELVRQSGIRAVGVVLGVALFHGVAITRGLGRMGVPVYCIGDPGSIGFHSRYATRNWELPDMHHNHEALLKLLVEIGRELKAEGKKGLLFPTTDRLVRFIGTNLATLNEYYLSHFPPNEIIERCADKQVQCRVAAEVGVPAPITYFEDQISRLLEDIDKGRLQFPILFKARMELPTHLRKQFRIIVIKDRAQLDSVLAAVAREKLPFLIQEIIPGEDDSLYTLGSCMGREGKLLAYFTGRKLRQRPPKFGECRVGESIYVEDIIRDGEKLLRALDLFGISQVEFKHDSRDGKYKLIEVNPRAWSWIGLPIGMGVNLAYASLCDAVGIKIPTIKMENKRVLWISLYFDLYWSLQARDAKPWSHLFRKYDQKLESYIACDDLKLSLVHIKRAGLEIAGMGFRFIWKRLTGKSSAKAN